MHIYCFREKNSPVRLFSSMCIGICPAHLLILMKNNPPTRSYLGLHIYFFLRIFPTAHLFRPTRLFGTLEYVGINMVLLKVSKNCQFLPPPPLSSDYVIYEWYPIARPLSAPPTSVPCSDPFGWVAATRKNLGLIEY